MSSAKPTPKPPRVLVIVEPGSRQSRMTAGAVMAHRVYNAKRVLHEIEDLRNAYDAEVRRSGFQSIRATELGQQLDDRADEEQPAERDLAAAIAEMNRWAAVHAEKQKRRADSDRLNHTRIEASRKKKEQIFEVRGWLLKHGRRAGPKAIAGHWRNFYPPETCPPESTIKHHLKNGKIRD
ncbi:MAG: hypothetical protein J7605_02720 [Variovorax sp.]|nr:hypothetical protein [Variovorax sp.]